MESGGSELQGSRHTFTFGEFELDFGRNELRQRGEPVELQPTPLRLLLYLAENRDRTVSKQELLDELWPDALVTDTSLANALNQARQAVGDDGTAQRVIRTRKGHGYRFVAESGRWSVAEVTKRPSRAIVAALGLTLLALGTGLLVGHYKTVQQTQLAPQAGEIQSKGESLVVLPLENLSSDPDNAYLAAGIHGEIVNQLARIDNLAVIARTTALTYANASKSAQEIAQELNVGTVMEGTVRFGDDRLRVTAQLINGKTGTDLWSEAYDRDLGDIFAIPSHIALQIAIALQAQYTDEERQAIEKPPSDSPEAYAHYLRAITYNRVANPLRPVIESLDKAIEIDPDFALAYARRALVNSAPFMGGSSDSTFDPETIQRKRAATLVDAERALELDPKQAEALIALAQLAE